MRSISKYGMIALVWLFAGCAAQSFNLSFPDNQAQVVQQTMARVQPKPITTQSTAAVAYLVSAKPASIVAYDIAANKVLWRAQGPVDSHIQVGTSLVYHLSGRTIVARSRANGQVVWQHPLTQGMRLLGMTFSGQMLYFAVEATANVERGAAALVALDGTSGSVKWRNLSGGRLGAPAARDGYVFVPLRYQWISIVNGLNGLEIARVRSTEEALRWVRATPMGVFFGGSSGVYRLNAKAASGARKTADFVSAALPKTVRPVYWWDGYNAALSGYTAYDRNRLLWRVAAGDGIGFRSNRVVVHNYRFFFGFETTGKASTLKWAYSFPRTDVVASTDTGASLLLISANGVLVGLDPKTGRPTMSRNLAKVLGVAKPNLVGVTFDAEGYLAPGTPKGEVNLYQTLAQVIWDPDRRFGEVKLFAVEQLARVGKKDDQRVAKALLQIVTREGVDPKVYKRAGSMIVSRHDKNAIGLYLDVLKRHYNFIEGSRASAVDIMAQALGDLKAPEAVRPLLLHLADHETSLPAVREIARALAAIGDKTALGPLRDYLLTYRSEPEFKREPQALNLVAEALLKLGGQDERQLLVFVGNDGHTLGSLRTYIKRALRQSKTPPKAAAVKPAKSAKPTKTKPAS